jgi:hypothetical protein
VPKEGSTEKMNEKALITQKQLNILMFSLALFKVKIKM